MSFELLEPTKARLDDIEVLSQKNRQADEAPGVKLSISMTLTNHVLATMDGFLKDALFTRSEANAPKPVANRKKDNQTGPLDGVEPVSDLPNLSGIGRHLKSFRRHEEVTGCAAEIRFATTVLKLDDCTVSEFKIKPKEGGSIELKCALEAPNASESVFAKMAKYKSREIEVMVVQHSVAEDPQQQLPADDTKGKKVPDTPGNTPGFPPSGSAMSTEKPPQAATTEIVKDKPEGSARRGLVRYLPGHGIQLTDEGRAIANKPAAVASNEELHARVLDRLSGPEQRLLKPLIEAYPRSMTNAELAAAAGYTAGAGAFNNPRGRLRSLGLLDYPQAGHVVARGLLFPMGAR